MLFQAEITREVLNSKDRLVEQLYVFLNAYVPTRLRYESQEEREDCVQDTIMYLLKRFDNLDDEVLEKINIEKFFYNRAHSFISGYINKIKAERNAKKKYIDNEIYMRKLERTIEKPIEFIDDNILDTIIEGYKLDKEKSVLLKEFSNFRFKRLGYDVPEPPNRDIDEATFDLLVTLSFAVIDEYMIKSAEERASG